MVDSHHYGTITGRLLCSISTGSWRQQRSDAKRVRDGVALGECGRGKALDAERGHLHSSTSRSRRSGLRNTLRSCSTLGHGPNPDRLWHSSNCTTTRRALRLETIASESREYTHLQRINSRSYFNSGSPDYQAPLKNGERDLLNPSEAVCQADLSFRMRPPHGWSVIGGLSAAGNRSKAETRNTQGARTDDVYNWEWKYTSCERTS